MRYGAPLIRMLLLLMSPDVARAPVVALQYFSGRYQFQYEADVTLVGCGPRALVKLNGPQPVTGSRNGARTWSAGQKKTLFSRRYDWAPPPLGARRSRPNPMAGLSETFGPGDCVAPQPTFSGVA